MEGRQIFRRSNTRYKRPTDANYLTGGVTEGQMGTEAVRVDVGYKDKICEMKFSFSHLSCLLF